MPSKSFDLGILPIDGLIHFQQIYFLLTPQSMKFISHPFVLFVIPNWTLTPILTHFEDGRAKIEFPVENVLN